jgi:hypothetical protein
MIISVEEAKKLIDFKEWSDEKLERKLNAIEQAIRSYTNNNFQKREIRKAADIVGSLFVCGEHLFQVGDTVQISESSLNEGLFTIAAVTDNEFVTNEVVVDEDNVLVTKVYYPADVVDCAINLLEWEINNRSKVGIQSETLSRHSVTYFNMDGDNSINGYPKSLFGALKAYKKARF